MAICKKQQIHNFCTPNALLTLKEYLDNYATPETKELGEKLLKAEKAKLSTNQKRVLQKRMNLLKDGKVVFF